MSLQFLLSSLNTVALKKVKLLSNSFAQRKTSGCLCETLLSLICNCTNLEENEQFLIGQSKIENELMMTKVI